jgi:hypothetical protein
MKEPTLWKTAKFDDGLLIRNGAHLTITYKVPKTNCLRAFLEKVWRIRRWL